MILNDSYGKTEEWTNIEDAGTSENEVLVKNEVTEKVRRIKETNKTEAEHVLLEVEKKEDKGEMEKNEKKEVIRKIEK